MFTFSEFRVMLEGNLNLLVGITIVTKRHCSYGWKIFSMGNSIKGSMNYQEEI